MEVVATMVTVITMVATVATRVVATVAAVNGYTGVSKQEQMAAKRRRNGSSRSHFTGSCPRCGGRADECRADGSTIVAVHLLRIGTNGRNREC